MKTYLFDFICRGLIEAESAEKAEKVLESSMIISKAGKHIIYVLEVQAQKSEHSPSEYLGLPPCSPSASTSESAGPEVVEKERTL